MKKLVAVIALVTLGSSSALAETKEFDINTIAKIEVHNLSGNIVIMPAKSQMAKVKVEKKNFGSACRLNVDQRGSTLYIEVQHTGFLGGNCEVDFEIESPKTAEFELEAGSGDIDVKGVSGDLAITVGAGDVNVDADIKDLKARAGSGDIAIKGLTKGGQLVMGSGDLKLTYNKAPTEGLLDIKTGSGDARVLLPSSTKVKTSFTTGAGSLINELGDSPNSLFQVSMKSGAGDLEIKKQ